ncbi:methylated-DNA--[protein]-cysteine S-methyltransferase [Rhodovulum sp. YEN HP10]|uniref:methylated-DNA--[protein]-cysteine S-methyltransferase n=1 Tax=Rhodovulum sp. HP10 TaxID=3387397 RepID=UPI0039E1874A
MPKDTDRDQNQAYHFSVIRRAIDRIDAAGGESLPLETLAAEMNMSPAHFQRVFSRWAGVSPKRYQQYLTLGHARALMRERFTTLETADALGLSGAGRLHDMFLRWEAMSPGDYARGGAGLEIRWGWVDSPFGPALVMATARGICGIGFAAETGSDAALADLTSRWPQASFVEDPAALAPWAEAAFGRQDDKTSSGRKDGNAVSGRRDGETAFRRQGGEARLHLIGAPFQIKVWEALLSVPPGQVTTYSEIARAIGHPRAVRAVGTAVGRNPIGYLIPCHRALRKTGALGGYHWGLPVKRAILAWEAARTEAELGPDTRTG